MQVELRLPINDLKMGKLSWIIWMGPMQSWGSLKVEEVVQREMYLWKNNQTCSVAGFERGKGQ